jgi:glycosyltransferase involved in cell wall biosynthesis
MRSLSDLHPIMASVPSPSPAEVTVLCLSYNASSFIEKCLSGIMSQITDFDFIILIHDDCSTDGSQAIIEGYTSSFPEKVYAILQVQNQYRQGKCPIRGSLGYISSKYVALCEADDYWDDPTKLARQVSFMRKNPERHFVGTQCRIVDGRGSVSEPFPKSTSNSSVFYIDGSRILSMQKYIHTSTHLVTRSLLMRWARLFSETIVSSDLTIQVTAVLEDGDLAVLKMDASRYRIHDGGAWSTALKRTRYGNYSNAWMSISNSLEGIAKWRHIRIAKDNLSFFDTLARHNWRERLDACRQYGLLPIIRTAARLLTRRIYGN